MAVLVEGYSIIINKKEALQNTQVQEALQSVGAELYPGAVCADQDLLRIGFLKLDEMQAFWKQLLQAGMKERIEVNGEEQAGDMVMLTQYGELEVLCPWLTVTFQKTKDNLLVCMASLKGSAAAQKAAFPKGWTADQSILRQFHDDRMHYMEENYDRIGEESTFYRFREKGGDKVVKLLKLYYSEPEQL
ncbi:hypothetical protein [Thiomicrorhabdus xiamenensis]|uniref:Uncharacterized protein n=1 Tax=Thiomicrorhabdus xiamenensis TaxID=2739063 RepID=A0A7D4NQU7_9GAMM|nr:hypothetical protein [Thiomicrorhabdus xiamenensis]QKI89037.1 hypothetical protein HQN79_05355 [Thiomicrorhabdus xiamenensis]